jgi:hypothetical protein
MEAETLDVVRRELGLPELTVVLRHDWGSSEEGSRARIRRHLFENFDADESVLDLNLTPRLPRHALSISHHRKVGGFALAPAPARIGFDLELRARARGDLVRRVCVTDEEFRAAPDPCALWMAKEAAYKSLAGPSQPPGLSDLEIRAWEPLLPDVFRCEAVRRIPRASVAERIRGVVLSGPDHGFALFSSEESCAGV